MALVAMRAAAQVRAQDVKKSPRTREVVRGERLLKVQLVRCRWEWFVCARR